MFISSNTPFSPPSERCKHTVNKFICVHRKSEKPTIGKTHHHHHTVCVHRQHHHHRLFNRKPSSDSSSGSIFGSLDAAKSALSVKLMQLNMMAVDQIYPVLSDLSASLNKLSILAPDYEGKIKMEWIARLAKMGASDELSDQQSRQLLFDLDSSYNSFMSALPNAGT